MKLSRKLLGLLSILGLLFAACGSSSSGGDGGTGTADAEIADPTAFRLNSLRLLDPHAFATFGICLDGTDLLNTSLNDAITMDGDMDGVLDLSMAIVFRPLDPSRSTTPVEVHFPDCTATATACTAAAPGGTPPVITTANNDSTTNCLAPAGGTTSGYNPGVPTVAAPCFASDPAPVSITVQGTQITLSDAQIGATYSGTPATSLTGGLLKGFISEADAQAIMFTLPDPPGGIVSLASVLPGGAGNCNNGDDRDTHNGVSGWWMYFDLSAQLVPWTD